MRVCTLGLKRDCSMKWELLGHRLTDSCLLNLACLSTSRISLDTTNCWWLHADRCNATVRDTHKVLLHQHHFFLMNGCVLGVSEIWGRGKWSLFQILLGALRARQSGGFEGFPCALRIFDFKQNPNKIAAVISWRAVC